MRSMCIVISTKHIMTVIPTDIRKKVQDVLDWAKGEDSLDQFFKDTLVLALTNLSNMEVLTCDPLVSCCYVNDDTIDFTAGFEIRLSEFILYRAINAVWKIRVEVLNSDAEVEISVDDLEWGFSRGDSFTYDIDEETFFLKDNAVIPEKIRNTLVEKIEYYLDQQPEMSICDKNIKKWRKRCRDAVKDAKENLKDLLATQENKSKNINKNKKIDNYH